MRFDQASSWQLEPKPERQNIKTLCLYNDLYITEIHFLHVRKILIHIRESIHYDSEFKEKKSKKMKVQKQKEIGKQSKKQESPDDCKRLQEVCSLSFDLMLLYVNFQFVNSSLECNFSAKTVCMRILHYLSLQYFILCLYNTSCFVSQIILDTIKLMSTSNFVWRNKII